MLLFNLKIVLLHLKMVFFTCANGVFKSKICVFTSKNGVCLYLNMLLFNLKIVLLHLKMVFLHVQIVFLNLKN